MNSTPMLASVLIQKLQDAIAKHGDLPVMDYSKYHFGFYHLDTEGVQLYDNKFFILSPYYNDTGTPDVMLYD